MAAENFKNFKAVGQDEHCYEIMHPNGKRLFVEKSKLSPEAHKAILHLYQGDMVGGDNDSTNADRSPASDGGNIFTRAYNALDNALMLPDERAAEKNKADWRSLAADAGPSVPMSQAPDAMVDRPDGFTRKGPMISEQDQAAIDAIRAQEGPVSGDADYVSAGPTEEQALKGAAVRSPDMYSDPLLAQKAGQQDLLAEQIKQQEEALAAGQSAGQDIAKVQESQAQALSKLPSYNDLVAKYQAKDEKLFQDVVDAKIDPQHFVHSMGTGSKILTGLGMIISGLGAASAGQPNYALGVVNDAIKRDIDAQKADQSNKVNLWKMNREAMGSDMAANLATENQIKAAALAQLQAAQTRAQLPQEKLRAQQAIDQMKQEMLMNNLRRGLLTQGAVGAQMNGHPALSIADPSMLVPEMVKDPSQQKAVYEEIKNRSNIAKNGAAMLKAFDQAANEVSGMGGVLHSAVEKTPGQLALEQLMMPNMSDLDGTVRQAAVNVAHDTIIPSFKDFGRADRMASKRQALVDWMASQSSAPISKGNYIDLDRFQKTAVPNFPAPPAAQGKGKSIGAPQTQIMHGHTYQKVPGGWKLVK